MKRINQKGQIIFCFNAHLPFAKFAQSGGIFQERWFFEAMLESYLPACRAFHQLIKEKTSFHLLLSLSPTLITLLQNEDLQTRFVFYIHQKLDIAQKELVRKQGTPDEVLAEYYVHQIKAMLFLYKQLGGDLLGRLKRAQERGYCEIITSAATMAFLPLYASFEYAVEAQITAATRQYRSVFGRAPRGFFLPYGGYYPGLDAILSRCGVKYFVSAGQALLQGEPKPTMGVFAPVLARENLIAFPRYSAIDDELWGDEGAANHECYRNFYHEESQEEIVIKASFNEYPTLFGSEVVHLEGFKYRNNSKAGDSFYDLELAKKQVKMDASAFVQRRVAELEQSEEVQQKGGLILAVADLELFGHRWFEGMAFVKEFFRAIAKSQTIVATTPALYLQRHVLLEKVSLSFASWGAHGYAQVWLDQNNDWLVAHIFRAVEQMSDLMRRFPDASGLKKRVLDQAMREVLLLMAGDWPLLVSQRVNEQVALRQIQKHLAKFNEIYEAMSRNVVRAFWLTEMEHEDDIFTFSKFSYKLFATDSDEASTGL
jgi:1,4-alpha-glucan branching enzyme